MSARVTKDILREMAKLADIELDENRLTVLTTLFQTVLQEIDKMEELDISDLDMEVNFDARWRKK